MGCPECSCTKCKRKKINVTYTFRKLTFVQLRKKVREVIYYKKAKAIRLVKWKMDEDGEYQVTDIADSTEKWVNAFTSNSQSKDNGYKYMGLDVTIREWAECFVSVHPISEER